MKRFNHRQINSFRYAIEGKLISETIVITFNYNFEVQIPNLYESSLHSISLTSLNSCNLGLDLNKILIFEKNFSKKKRKFLGILYYLLMNRGLWCDNLGHVFVGVMNALMVMIFIELKV